MSRQLTQRTVAASRDGIAAGAAPTNATHATRLYRALKHDIIRGGLAPCEWLRIDMLRKRYGAGASSRKDVEPPPGPQVPWLGCGTRATLWECENLCNTARKAPASQA